MTANNLDTQEIRLLQLINSPISTVLQSHYDVLVQKQRFTTLRADEHAELLQIIEQIEQFDADRVEYLVSLAQLRQVTLGQLMQDLGIQQPEYV
jgi:hypothetical protein